MNKQQFKKYQTKITLIILSIVIAFIILALLSFYNKEVGDILNIQIGWRKRSMYSYIFAFCVIILFDIAGNYFWEKRKKESRENITKKGNKIFGKNTFYFFLLTTFLSMVFLIFILRGVDTRFDFSIFWIAFYAFIINLVLAIFSKFI